MEGTTNLKVLSLFGIISKGIAIVLKINSSTTDIGFPFLQGLNDIMCLVFPYITF